MDLNRNRKGRKRQRTLSVGNEDEQIDITSFLKIPRGLVTMQGSHIYFYDDVNVTSCLSLNLALRNAVEHNLSVANSNGTEPSPVYIHINSPGGTVFDALTSVDLIEQLKENVPIISIVEGLSETQLTQLHENLKRYK